MITPKRGTSALYLALFSITTPASAFAPHKDVLSRSFSTSSAKSTSYDFLRLPHTRVPALEKSLVRRNVRDWDGDDMRFLSKMRRRILRRQTEGANAPAITSLIVIISSMFLYQTISTVDLIRRQNPAFWPSDALSIITDTLLGATSVRGPLTLDFIFSGFLARLQPHRYLTAGFLHGDIIHLLLNLNALQKLPLWLETGLGAPLFLTTLLVSIIAGNACHAFSTSNMISRSMTMCLGASGGILGIYGLMYVALVKMGNSHSAGRVIKGVLLLLVAGLFLDNVSNAGHVGGFIGGLAMGIFFGPSYKKSYSMNRKWSLEVDLWPRDYRQVMGFAVAPTKRGLLPLSALWAVVALLMALEPKFRSIPSCIVRGLLKPGSLSLL